MKNYRPLLLQELEVRLPGSRIRRLRLNRHLPDVDSVAEHAHTFCQILYYVSGNGVIEIEDTTYDVNPRSVIFLPPKARHFFRETEGRRPLCLVIDLEWRGAGKLGAKVQRLSQTDATTVRQALSELMGLQQPSAAGCRFIAAALVLRMVDVFFRQMGLISSPPRQSTPLVRKMDGILQRSGTALPRVSALAEEMGYQVDYLNRVFTRRTGHTLREYRDAILIKRAKRLLLQLPRIKNVCDALGFEDQNYFSRWFKKYTAETPQAYRRTRT